MNFREFLAANGLTKANCKVGESKKSTYSDTKTKIIFVRLSKAINNQDYLVLSRNAAEAIKSKKQTMLSLEASYDEDYGWGIIMPPDFTELDVKW